MPVAVLLEPVFRYRTYPLDVITIPGCLQQFPVRCNPPPHHALGGPPPPPPALGPVSRLDGTLPDVEPFDWTAPQDDVRLLTLIACRDRRVGCLAPVVVACSPVPTPTNWTFPTVDLRTLVVAVYTPPPLQYLPRICPVLQAPFVVAGLP